MKKASFPAIVSTTIVLYVFWLLITGQIPAVFNGGAAVQTLIAGLLVCLAVAAFSARFFIHENAFHLFNPARFFTLLVYCIVIFPVELVKANLDVAIRALSPSLRVKPGIVKVPTKLKSDYGLSMLANSITLTPGTITMDIADEGEETNLYVHWIDVATEDAESAGNTIKGTMESWIGRIFK